MKISNKSAIILSITSLVITGIVLLLIAAELHIIILLVSILITASVLSYSVAQILSKPFLNYTRDPRSYVPVIWNINWIQAQMTKLDKFQRHSMES